LHYSERTNYNTVSWEKRDAPEMSSLDKRTVNLAKYISRLNRDHHLSNKFNIITKYIFTNLCQDEVSNLLYGLHLFLEVLTLEEVSHLGIGRLVGALVQSQQ
jgi:hypothetical protein